MIHELDEQLGSNDQTLGPSLVIDWTQLIHLELFNEDGAQFYLNFEIGIGITRLVKLEILRYKDGLPTGEGVSFGPEDHRFLSAILHDRPEQNGFTTVQFVEDYVEFKQNRKLLIFPKEAFEALKSHCELITNVLKFQRRNSHEVAELIVRLVIFYVFEDYPKNYKNHENLEPARIIGNYFNISEAKLQEVLEYGYLEHNNILYSCQLRYTILWLLKYNNFNVR